MCISPLALLDDGAAAGATPQAMQAAGLTTQAWASGLGALGSLASGVMRARAARADAAGVRAAGESAARRVRRAGEVELGRARGDAAAAGVSLRSGSVMDAEHQIVRNVEQDAGVAIINGAIRARALEADGRMDMVSGALGALAGLSYAADRWKRAKDAATYAPPVKPSPRDPVDY